MSAEREAAWETINAEFSSLANQMRTTNPEFWWSCGHAENDAFPFWAYASFGRSGRAGEEDVVVSLAFKNEDGRLVFTSDLALGDGQIVAEGPGEHEPLDSDRTAWVGAQTSEGATFIRSQLETLRRLLSTFG